MPSYFKRLNNFSVSPIAWKMFPWITVTRWTHSSPKVPNNKFPRNNRMRESCRAQKWRQEMEVSHIMRPFSQTVFVCLIIKFLQRLPTNTPCLVWCVWELQYVCTRAALMLSHRWTCGCGVHASRSVASMFLQPWQKNKDASKQTAEYGGKRFMATIMISSRQISHPCQNQKKATRHLGGGNYM